MKTMGQLYDDLKAIEKAEAELTYAESRLAHGGSAETIKQKEEMVTHAQDWLTHLRSERIEDEE